MLILKSFIRLNLGFQLVLVQWIIIVLAWFFLYSSMGQPEGCFFMPCITPALILVIVPAIPGLLLSQLLTFLFDSSSSQSSFFDLEHFSQLINGYVVTSLIIFLLGNLINFTRQKLLKIEKSRFRRNP